MESAILDILSYIWDPDQVSRNAGHCSWIAGPQQNKNLSVTILPFVRSSCLEIQRIYLIGVRIWSSSILVAGWENADALDIWVGDFAT